MQKINYFVFLSLFLLTGSCAAVRDCTVSVPVPNKTPKTYSLTINTTILREAEMVLAHKPFYLAKNSEIEPIGLLQELYTGAKAGKPVNNNKFIALKKSDWSGTTGSMIVSLKNSLYVAKLFRVDPANFGMGAGLADLGMWLVNRVNRFMLGFTRLSNRARMVSWLKKPEAKKFKDLFVVPRKRLWIPADATWMTISWTDAQNNKRSVTLPDTYIILCDACKKSRDLTKQESNLIFELIKKAPQNITIDPNPTNFIVDKNNKIVLIDTENIDYTAGSHIQPGSYVNWVIQLIGSSLNTALITACCEIG